LSRSVVALKPNAQPVPKDWQWSRIDKLAIERCERAGEIHELPVLSVTKHRGIVRAEDYFKKTVHGRNTANYKVVRRDQFAYATIHLDEGSIGLLQDMQAGIVSPMYTVFEPTLDVEKYYLLSLLKSSDALLVYRRLAEGTVNRRSSIGFESLGSLYLLLPPLTEQRKIAAVLSSVDKVIRENESFLKRLRAAKKAIAHELLTRGLPGRHTLFRRTAAGELPEQWRVTPLREVANLFNGRAAGTGGSWLRVFKTKHVYDGMIRLQQPEFARDDTATKVPTHTYLLDGDTVTPNMAHGTIGRVAYVPRTEGKWATDGQVMVVRTQDGNVLDHRFLFEYISSARGRRYLLDCEKGSIFDEKRGQTHVYPTDVGRIPAVIPPIDEQRAIAKILVSFDAPHAENTRCVARLRELKTVLMRQLFTGELRVRTGEDVA
jgi:type I restriction enzyme S subunit